MSHVLKVLFFVSILVSSVSIMPFTFAETEVFSPVKQMRYGVAIKNIHCKDNLILVVRTLYGLPLCVKQSSFQKLEELGIVTTLSNNMYNGVVSNYLQEPSWVFVSRVIPLLRINPPTYPSVDNHALNQYPALRDAMIDADNCYFKSKQDADKFGGECTALGRPPSNCVHRVNTISSDQANQMISNPLLVFKKQSEVEYFTFESINNTSYYIEVGDYQPPRNYDEMPC